MGAIDCFSLVMLVVPGCCFRVLKLKSLMSEFAPEWCEGEPYFYSNTRIYA